MLLNLLPALRDLRSPLAAGYALLVASYLAFADLIKRFFESSTHGKYISDVATHIGIAATLASITFIAFIVGSIWVDLVPSLCRKVLSMMALPYRYLRIRIATKELPLDKAIAFINSLPGRKGETYTSAEFRGVIRRIVQEKVMKSVAQDENYREAIRQRLLPPEYDNDSLDRDADAVFKAVDIERHITMMVEDVKNVPVRLLGAEPDLWNAWDRLRGEGEFRSAMATAIAPLMVALSITITPWCLLMSLVIVALWVLGEGKSYGASRMLFESLAAGRVTVSELEKVGEYKYTYWLRDTKEIYTRQTYAASQPGRSWKRNKDTGIPRKSRVRLFLQGNEKWLATALRREWALWNASRYRKLSS